MVLGPAGRRCNRLAGLTKLCFQATIDLQLALALCGLMVQCQVQTFLDKLLLESVNLALSYAQPRGDVRKARALRAVPGLVTVEQDQGINDFGRCVCALACNVLQLGSFLL